TRLRDIDARGERPLEWKTRRFFNRRHAVDEGHNEIARASLDGHAQVPRLVRSIARGSFASTQAYGLSNLRDRWASGRRLCSGIRGSGFGIRGSAGIRCWFRTLRRRIRGTADTGQRVETHPLTVDADLELLIFGVERQALVQVAREPRPDLVLTVHREHIADRRASAGPERKPRQMCVLRQIVGDAEVVDV